MWGCDSGHSPCGRGILLGALLWSSAAFTSTHHAGATLGQFEVDSNGAATYTIPLKVPPGAGGLQPELSLVYNSQQGNGLLGVGWSLGGLSAITRCPATKLADGLIDPVDYDNHDRFCMDGQRLIAVIGTDGADGTEYRTQKTTQSRIVSYGVTGSGPSYFKVWTAAGLVIEYGNTSDSAFEGAQGVAIWAVSKISDTAGNSINFQYYENQTTREHRLTEIMYGGSRAVRINWQVTAESVSYALGTKMVSKHQIASIDTVSQGALATRYNFTYESGPPWDVARLVNIEECDAGGSCKPASTFTYTDPGMIGNKREVAISYFDYGPGLDEEGTRAYVDVNGDGRADMCRMQDRDASGLFSIKCTLNLSNDSGTSIPQDVITTGFSSPGHDWAETRAYADVNGDGKADYCRFEGPMADGRYGLVCTVNLGSGGWQQIVTTTGFATGGRNKPGSRAYVDVTGDGRADYCRQEGPDPSGQYYVACTTNLGTGGQQAVVSTSGFNSALGHDTAGTRSYADINGDGKADFCRLEGPYPNGTYGIACTTNLSEGGYQEIITTTGFGYGPGYDVAGTRAYTDVNADGRADFCRLEGPNPSGNYQIQCAVNLSVGGAADDTVSVGYDAGMGYDWQGTRTYVDANADGKADICRMVDSPVGGQEVWCSVSLDKPIWQQTLVGRMGVDKGIDTQGSRGYPDVNGDGKADFCRVYGPMGGTYHTFCTYLDGNPGVIRNLLQTVTTGLGDRISVNYKPLTESSVYTKYSDATYPTVDIQGATYVVSSYSQADGVGGEYSFAYHYEGAKAHTETGMLGFRKMDVTDQRTGITTTTTYRQTFPEEGRVESSETRLIDGTLISRTVNTWTSADYGKRYSIYLQSTDEYSYELDGSLISHVTTTQGSWDSYGNVLQITVDSHDGYIKTTTNTYFNDHAKWYVGRLTRAQVTSTAPGGYADTRTSAFEYDPTTGLLTKEIVEPDTPELRLETAYQYDAFGNKTVVKVSGADIATRTTTTQYDPSGTFPVHVTNAEGHTETRQFDPRWGVMTSLTGPNGLTTTWDYDSLGRKIAEHRADGTSTTITYTLCESGCAFGAPLIITKQDDGSVPKTVYYDALGREVMSATVGFDGRTVYKKTEYDAYGRVLRVSRPYFDGDSKYWTTYQYDVLGRMTYETNPDGSYTDVVYAGLTKTTTNDQAQSYVEIKDSQGQIVQVIDADNNSSHYSYDAFGNLVKTTDAANHVTTMSYDLRGRKVAMNDPDMGQWSYRYDALGQLVWQRDAKGQVVSMAYDKLGRMVQRSEAEGLSKWTYDTQPKGIGKLAVVTSPGGYQREQTYDSLGRPSASVTTIAGSVYNQSVAYDAYSRVQTKTYPTGFAIRNVYNSRGYLAEIRNAANDALYWQANYADASGNIGEETLGNGLSTLRTFDADSGRLTAIVTGGTGQVQLLSYEYDTLGNLRQRRDDNQGLTENFGYDNLNRLVSAAVVGGTTKTYQYDAIGNLTYKSDVGNYTYGQNGAGPHAVTRAGSADYTYDANGNQITGDGRNIVYTSFNKPLQITKGEAVNDYQYDADHQRIVKTSQVGASAGGGAEVIVDNTDANTSQVGTWSVSSASGAYGTNSVYRDSAGTFRWTPNLPAQGAYKVYARWTYHSNRGTQVPYRVTHSAGTSEIIVNQHDQSLGGEWVLLGTYEFAAGSAGYVEVSAENGQANADAVKFVQVDSANTGTTITHYLGKGYERVQTPTGVVEHKHYISAAGTTVLYTQRSNAANDTRYLHKDHLGSTDVITDEQGQVVERLSFDAWGARRNPNWTNAPNYGFHLTSLVTRGFTGHNQDDAVGLIDMNARLYDAKLGRFLQPDAFVQHPYTTQGMNRYTYVNNNPLSFTDPTGHFLKKLFKGVKKLFKSVGKFLKKYGRVIVAAIVAYYTFDFTFWKLAAKTANSIAANSVIAGAAAGAASAVVLGQNPIKGAVNGALLGFLAGAAAYANPVDQLRSTWRVAKEFEISKLFHKVGSIAMNHVFGRVIAKQVAKRGWSYVDVSNALMSLSMFGNRVVGTRISADDVESGIGIDGILSRKKGWIPQDTAINKLVGLPFDVIDITLGYQGLPTATIRDFRLYAGGQRVVRGHSLGSLDASYVAARGIVEYAHLDSLPFGNVAPSNTTVHLGTGDVVNGGVFGFIINPQAKPANDACFVHVKSCYH